jgi:hypothetical protein
VLRKSSHAPPAIAISSSSAVPLRIATTIGGKMRWLPRDLKEFAGEPSWLDGVSGVIAGWLILRRLLGDRTDVYLVCLHGYHA